MLFLTTLFYCSSTRMLTVNTYLAPSSIHGVGLFAAELIPANSIIWQDNEHIDTIYSEGFFLNICRNAHKNTLQHLLNCSYKRGGRYFYLTNNAQFMNHSETLDNFVHGASKSRMSAFHQILKGDELICNYLSCNDPDDFHVRNIKKHIIE